MRQTIGVSLGVILLPVLLFADFPEPTGYVTDVNGILSGAARAELEQLLRETEQQTSAEIAVAIVPSLDGLSVEEYANRLFQAWGVGQKRVDNGVLVLVAPTEREMRIEVGYGLEPILPDGLAGEIIRTNFLPRFRDDDYAGGIRDGVARVVDVVKRKHVLTAEERRALEEAAEADDRPPVWVMIPFFGLFVTIGFYMVGVGLGSKTWFPLLFGGFFGGMPFLLSFAAFFSTPIIPIVVLGPLALAVAAIGYRKGRRGSAWVRQMHAASGASTEPTGWVLGANSDTDSADRSDSSSSSSSSSDSFGGGSSGGGGASGRW